jgi:hypothetical protein
VRGTEAPRCYHSAAIFSLRELSEQAVRIDRRTGPDAWRNQVRAELLSTHLSDLSAEIASKRAGGFFCQLLCCFRHRAALFCHVLELPPCMSGR